MVTSISLILWEVSMLRCIGRFGQSAWLGSSLLVSQATEVSSFVTSFGNFCTKLTRNEFCFSQNQNVWLTYTCTYIHTYFICHKVSIIEYKQAVRLGGRHNMPPPLLTVGQRVDQSVINPSIAQGSCHACSRYRARLMSCAIDWSHKTALVTWERLPNVYGGKNI